jgi:hypothetical protein
VPAVPKTAMGEKVSYIQTTFPLVVHVGYKKVTLPFPKHTLSIRAFSNSIPSMEDSTWHAGWGCFSYQGEEEAPEGLLECLGT